MAKRIKMLLAEDEPVIMRGIRRAIMEIDDTIEIVAMVEDGQEAYEKILELKPDIVISDIKMPVMSGLDVLEKVKEAHLNVKFVLLTGYEKFEYAQKAIQYGAVDYLLKPINLDKLKICLAGLKEQILQERREKIVERIRRYYHKEPSSLVLPDNVKRYAVIECLYGCMGRSGYDEFHICSQLEEPFSTDWVSSQEETYDVIICREESYYCNERIFIIVDFGGSSDLEALIKAMYRRMLTDKVFLSMIYAKDETDFEKMPLVVNQLRMNLGMSIVFSQNQMIDTKEMSVRSGTQEMKVSQEIKEQGSSLSISMSGKQLEQYVKKVCDIWTKKALTQIQLMEDMKYILHFVWKQTIHMPDNVNEVSEIIFYAYDYEDLYTILLNELKRLLFNNVQEKREEHSLPQNIKVYLDNHFTEQIAYGEMDKIFGYNVKYISAVFKEAFGMSPSKYVMDAKIKLAKKILQENPGMMLKDVAKIVGYEDALYFSRVFRNNTGMSPTQFARKDAGNEK